MIISANWLYGLKAVHNTVKHLASAFNVSKDFARLYLQLASVEQCLELYQAHRALLQPDIG